MTIIKPCQKGLQDPEMNNLLEVQGFCQSVKLMFASNKYRVF